VANAGRRKKREKVGTKKKKNYNEKEEKRRGGWGVRGQNLIAGASGWNKKKQ